MRRDFALCIVPAALVCLGTLAHGQALTDSTACPILQHRDLDRRDATYLVPLALSFPAYPAGFLPLAARDSATIEAVVDTTGALVSCSIHIRSITSRVLAPVLLAALARERWRPAEADGQRVPLRLRETVYFFPADEAAKLERQPLPPMAGEAPVLFPDAPEPFYPSSLQSRRPGHVVLIYTVALTGRVDMSSVHVVSADDSAFTREVLRVLPHWRYRTPIHGLNGQPVAPMIRQEFLFTPPLRLDGLPN